MPNFRTIIVSTAEANNAVPIAAFSGDAALIGPSAMVIFASNATPLTPNDPTVSIQLFPSGHIATGTDSNGNISVTATLVNNGDDQTFSIAGGGTYSHAAGLWPDRIRAILASVPVVNVEFDIQYSGNSLINLTPAPPPFPTPTDVTITNITDPDPNLPTKMDVTVRFANPDHVNYPNLHALITRSQDGNTPVMVATTPVLAVGDTTFTDVPDRGHLYTYYVYLYDNSTLNVTAAPVSVSTIIIADPSGIYTLTPGKTHDTLYDHAGGTFNVAIPNPFIKTAFLGD